MGFESISSTHPSDQTLRDHATATWTAGSEGPPGPQSMSTLPHLTIGEVHDASDLMVRSELGRGGMGVVHLARQHSLERDVAIKRVHDDGKPHVVTALIREARMMSLVEHPNVIPVHAMGLDDHGRPAVVMKRVEGTAWRNLIRDPDHAGWSALMDQGRDRLDDHIRVLLDVCNAVHFAHSRGLLHRDLKPENVMLGCFGEVYVLDWGLAIPIEEGRAQTRHLVGTPA